MTPFRFTVTDHAIQRYRQRCPKEHFRKPIQHAIIKEMQASRTIGNKLIKKLGARLGQKLPVGSRAFKTVFWINKTSGMVYVTRIEGPRMYKVLTCYCVGGDDSAAGVVA